MSDIRGNGGARRTRRRAIAVLLLVTAVGAVFVFRGPLFRGNFGVVDPGRVFRSAQPTGGLAGLIQDRSLGSILNLRGGSPRDPWYVNEVRACRSGQVDFYDLAMSATERPPREDLLKLIDLFDSCKYPLLIHCKSGSDRTGLASALYLMTAKGLPPEEALRSFTISYGHVPLFGTKRLHEPFHEYAAWLKDRALPHAPDRFREWVEHEYEDPATVGPLQALKPGPRVPLFGRVIFSGEPVTR